MFVYDRRRAVASDAESARKRLTIPQKIRVVELESSGWSLRCLRTDDGGALMLRGREAIWVRADGSWVLDATAIRAGEFDADSLPDAVLRFDTASARSEWRRDHRG